MEETPIAVGDLVRVRADRGSAAARKYAGWHGRVARITLDTTTATIFVRVDSNNSLETAKYLSMV